MGSKYVKISLSILQIIVGLLGGAVFVKRTLYNEPLEMTLISFALMVLGLWNGIRGISETKE